MATLKRLVRSGSLACLLSGAQGQTTVRWLARVPGQTWPEVHGKSCDEQCATLSTTLGQTLACHASRLGEVNTKEKLAGVNKALEADGLTELRCTGSTTPYHSGVAISYAPYSFGEISGGICFWYSSSSSSPAPSCSDTSEIKRLCCCTAIDEDPRVYCPVSPQDCINRTWWDSATHRCTPCPQGRWSSNAGPTSAQECTGCGAGKFQPSTSFMPLGSGDDSVCSGRCSAGKWSASTGLGSNDQCIELCSAGKHGNGETGLTSDSQCSLCLAGRFSTAQGLQEGAQCTSMCESGKYSRVAGLTSGNDCSSCVNETIAPPGSTECSSCEKGKVPNQNHGLCVDPALVLCAAGEYATPSRICAQCPLGRRGQATNGSSTLCTECSLGRYSNTFGSSSCISCPANEITGIVWGSSNCKLCERGKIRDIAAIFCSDCGVGRFRDRSTPEYTCVNCASNRASSVPTDDACMSCSSGEIPDASAATCATCAVGAYSSPSGGGNQSNVCVRCPARGAICTGGMLSLDEGSWYDTKLTKIISEETEVHKCFNDESCLLDESKSSVQCNSARGYSGPLCGACDQSRGFVRAGSICSSCPSSAVSWLVCCALIFAFALCMIHVAALRNTTSRAGEFGGIIRRIAFSYVQMLGVLGIFKARGTRVFNEWVGKTSEVAGGSISALTSVKCLFETQAYDPFIMNMLLPVAVAVSVLIIMIPTALLHRSNERYKQRMAIEMRTRREAAVLNDGDRALFVPPRWEPIVDVGGIFFSVPRNVAIGTPCCRKHPGEEFIRNARRKHAGQLRLAPEFRALLPVDPFEAAGIPHALLVALPCCRVDTTSEERKAWRAATAVQLQTLHFKPSRRITAVMVLLMYSLFPTLVASTASMFGCSDKIGGKQYLLADFTQVCYEGKHLVYLSFAAVSVVVYCFGTPLLLAIRIMFKTCDCKAPTCSKVESDRVGGAARLGALFEGKGATSCQRRYLGTCTCICTTRSSTPWGYRTANIRERFGLLLVGYDTERGPIVMAWEPLVVMLRKLFITLAGSLPRDPYIQITIALSILLASITLQALVQPYESTLVNVLDVISLFVLIVTQVLSIVYLHLDTKTGELPLDLTKSDIEIIVTLLLFAMNITVIVMLLAAWVIRTGYEKLGRVARRALRKGRREVDETQASPSRGGGAKGKSGARKGRAVERDVELAVLHENAYARRRAEDGGVAVGGDVPPGSSATAAVFRGDDRTVAELQAALQEKEAENEQLKAEIEALEFEVDLQVVCAAGASDATLAVDAAAAAAVAVATGVDPSAKRWFFADHNYPDTVHGPFPLEEYQAWHAEGHFDLDQPIHLGDGGPTITLKEAFQEAAWWFVADFDGSGLLSGPYALMLLKEWQAEGRVEDDQELRLGESGESTTLLAALRAVGLSLERETASESRGGRRRKNVRAKNVRAEYRI